MKLAHKNRVLRSINADDASHCVDIFERPDGSIGFEEFRRDVEDRSGWFPIGGHSAQSFADENSALKAALAAVPWLADIINSASR